MHPPPISQVSQEQQHKLTGELALVPPTEPTRPPMTTWKPWPWAATSGYARPVRLSDEGKQLCQTTLIRCEPNPTHLNSPAFVLPRPLRNVDTAKLW